MSHIQDWFSFLLLGLAFIFLVRTIQAKTQTKARLPPSPPAFPVIGHLYLLSKQPHKYFLKISKRYGQIVYLRFGYRPSLLVTSAEIAKECLKTNESCFLNHGSPMRSNLKYLTYGGSDMIFTPYGPYWKFLKKLTTTKLLGGSILESYLPIRREETNNLIQNLVKKEGEEIDVGIELRGLTNNFISRMAFNKKCAKKGEEAYEMRHTVDKIVELIGKSNVEDLIWFFTSLDLQGFRKKTKEVRDRYENLVGKIIKEHEEKKRRRKERGGDDLEEVKDILDWLLEAYEDESSEIKFTKENILGYVLNLFVGGTEPLAVAIEWALSELITNPKWMAKARQEIDQVVGKNRIVEESDIPNLPCIQAIVKETFRLHPGGAFISRESSEDCSINGYHIPANTMLLINGWAINRDPNYWENPLEFKPERFLNEDGTSKKELDVRGQIFQLMPFGSGRRLCPGINLTLLVVPTTLAAIVQGFDWKVGKDGNGCLDMEEGVGISLPRAKPLVCVPMARLNPFPILI